MPNHSKLEITWYVKEGSLGKSYFSDKRSEFVIYKEGDFWILNYTDFWTVSPNSFFVNIKTQHDEMFAVPELKKFAQKIFDEYSKQKVQPSSVRKGIVKPLVSGISSRSLKFRAFDDGKMIYEKDINHLSMEDNLVLRLAKFWSNVRNDSHIMQFSGEKDNRGNDIYEGDIFQPFSEGILFYVVKFEKGAFVLYHNYGYWGTLARFNEVAENLKVERVIIGNVFQNPELLG